MQRVQPSSELASDVIDLLRKEQKPLRSSEIARKLNKNAHDILAILFDKAYQKIIQVIIHKDETNVIYPPTYTIRNL
ncbi:hypothetical protein M3N64_06365 [Sporolactobacillus sp. CPB3-1]|uniref:Transcriptional regulator n=1 Tax=Sporolactobacillus mangiferae TaxID=2940498 RepID=A0ABT0M9M3_9BACL|nr:hypothetical protein [Sporolactobacillus mangiferae]MCL1631572.1 hypothetical protein [Sporolactobacillus mangiferae]